MNLNRFKHERTIKRNSKQRGDLLGSKSIRARKVKTSGWKDELDLGSIVVDGDQCHHDVPITADGNVKKRKGSFTAHGSREIKKLELEGLSRGQPQLAVVGTGRDDPAHMGAEAHYCAEPKQRKLCL